MKNIKLSTSDESSNIVNDGLMASNKELQSRNGDLQTTNQALTTTIGELESRNKKVAAMNEALVQLLTSIETPVIILDRDRFIKSFSHKAESIMNLREGDVGLQISFIKPKIRVENLEQQILEVMQTLTINESEVQDLSFRWHKLQIRPYMAADGKLAGTIISLIDIQELHTPLTSLLLQAQLLP